MCTAPTIVNLLLEDEPDFDADEYMSTDPLSAEQRTLEKMGFKEIPVPMFDNVRGDMQWKREREGTCIYVYHVNTLDRWVITGQVFVVNKSEWYSVAGDSVEYKPLMGDVFADLINKMQEKCDAANYRVQLGRF